MLRAIKMRTKFDALLTKLAQAAQAEDLKTAAVREYGARPGSETVKPAVPANELMPGTEVEVFPRIMGAPMAAKSSGATALTEPTVPTGMKIGVGISPCAV